MPAKQPEKYHTTMEYTIKISMEQNNTTAGWITETCSKFCCNSQMRAETLAVASIMKILADASWFTRRCELPRIWQKRIFFNSSQYQCVLIINKAFSTLELMERCEKSCIKLVIRIGPQTLIFLKIFTKWVIKNCGCNWKYNDSVHDFCSSPSCGYQFYRLKINRTINYPRVSHAFKNHIIKL